MHFSSGITYRVIHPFKGARRKYAPKCPGKGCMLCPHATRKRRKSLKARRDQACQGQRANAWPGVLPAAHHDPHHCFFTSLCPACKRTSCLSVCILPAVSCSCALPSSCYRQGLSTVLEVARVLGQRRVQKKVKGPRALILVSLLVSYSDLVACSQRAKTM
jgi:hypothetical protein